MRILADENVSRALVQLLREQGHDVRWINAGDAGLDDILVWAVAKAEQRFLITSDKIFASWSMLQPEAQKLGLMLLRIPTLSAAEAAQRVVKVISSQDDWSGKFCVVSAEGIRIRQI
jgi:predicted nuclease of predicted toxin-antitoxin system